MTNESTNRDLLILSKVARCQSQLVTIRHELLYGDAAQGAPLLDALEGELKHLKEEARRL
jgi:hypothetical protein